MCNARQGDDGMSIKNPFTEENYEMSEWYDDGDHHYSGAPERDAFNEGVKAANEDWIEWVEKHFASCQDDCEEDDVESGCRFIRKDIWEAHKKELNQ